MQRGKFHRRLLMYSHDTFGLGHLRRCRAIAHALVNRIPDLRVRILSGSPLVGSFSFRNGVDFVRLPGVIKLEDGDYRPLNPDVALDAVLAMRARLIRQTAETFDPHLFIVDKEPLGLRGEVKDTLSLLKARGTPLILGLRDVLDEPTQLAEEWERKNAIPALVDIYDEIWVYGLPLLCNALEGLPVPPQVEAKIRYTGYLRRERTETPCALTLPDSLGKAPFLLVTTGGGGDGAFLIDWVLRAYEERTPPPLSALLVLGPFMRSHFQAQFMERAERLRNVHAITFDANPEHLMTAASGVVAMGGYNTFCEILSFDKPAVIVPRTRPRQEQLIRASRADAAGLLRMLCIEDDASAARMSAALRTLPAQPPPSSAPIPDLLSGLDCISNIVARWFADTPPRTRRLAVAGESC